MGRIGGTIQFIINGVTFRAKSNYDVRFDGEQRESVMGQDGRHGHKTTQVPGMLSGTISVTDDVSIRDIIDVTNGTVELVGPNGASYICSDADYTGDRTYNTEEGELNIQFDGLIEEVRI